MGLGLARLSCTALEHLFDNVAARREPREDDGVRYGLGVDLAGTERLIERQGLQFPFIQQHPVAEAPCDWQGQRAGLARS